MAIKPTIYKFHISLSDLNRDYYDSLNLTIALHPSETLERMMARVMAYCIEAQEGLAFTKGLSEVEEPDIWVHTLDNQIALWIDAGEPSLERIKKATRLAQTVKVFSFNSKSDVWWEQSKNKVKQLSVSVLQLDWESIQSLVKHVQRTMNFSVTITGESAFIASETGECEVNWVTLQ
ncbi:YaeQ family protein [Aliikangiella coralliicola]|uniref:YaeQ family protein n=1 Tax=Aliikangiella coralliicola TaxID=2592383 RepID=A0A545UDU1_9GAMM|nr:YaeQ family protein [Aliikangiella coralliicola]TQV87637.1 YaeQ family protein [Aliikangiella coralliicola]